MTEDDEPLVHDRPLYAHGPLVRLLLVLQAACLLLAAVALTITFVAVSNKTDKAASDAEHAHIELNAIQKSRFNSAYDQCLGLRHLVYTDGADDHPPETAKELKTRLTDAGLTDCLSYAYERSTLSRP